MKPLADYMADLRRARPDSTAVFMCPVCLREFGEEPERTGIIAKAHVFPKKVGGSYRTRACKECDEQLGDGVEGPVVSFLGARRRLLGRAVGKLRCKAKITIGQRTVVANISRTRGHLDIRVPQKGALDDVSELPRPIAGQGREHAAEHHRFPDIRVTLSPYDKNLVKLSLILALKVAYYTAFEQHGYSYILRDELAWVRTQLRDPESECALYSHTVHLRDNPFAVAGESPGTCMADVQIDGHEGLLCISGFWNVGFLTVLPPVGPAAWVPSSGYGLSRFEDGDAVFPEPLIDQMRLLDTRRKVGAKPGAA